MFQFVKPFLFAASMATVLLGTQLASPAVFGEDPPPPKPADQVVPSLEHHVLNSSPVLDRKHADSAATESRMRKSRRYYSPYVYHPTYYYYYTPYTNPGMVNGAAMYFPDPGSYAYGFTADGFGYGF